MHRCHTICFSKNQSENHRSVLYHRFPNLIRSCLQKDLISFSLLGKMNEEIEVNGQSCKTVQCDTQHQWYQQTQWGQNPFKFVFSKSSFSNTFPITI